jgi:hypothetical protein
VTRAIVSGHEDKGPKVALDTTRGRIDGRAALAIAVSVWGAAIIAFAVAVWRAQAAEPPAGTSPPKG